MISSIDGIRPWDTCVKSFLGLSIVAKVSSVFLTVVIGIILSPSNNSI